MSRIPKIIHYVWIGGAPLPELAERCMASWKKHMPEWVYMRWDESNFDIAAAPLYVRQAYEVKKFAFVSDYVRLWALEQYGGLYMDVDFLVHRPFDDIMDKYTAFAGYEGSKYQPVMLGVMASEAHGEWVKGMMQTYDSRPFIKEDGSYDMIPNSAYFTNWLNSMGFIADGVEKDFFVESQELRDESQELRDESRELRAKSREFLLHVFPVQYFCPVLTTLEDVRTEETYCEHMRLGSWGNGVNWKMKLLSHFSPKVQTKIMKIKRRIFG